MPNSVTSTMQLKYSSEYSCYKNEACDATCLLTTEAPKLDTADRSPISLSMVLDRSGSMSGHKLELVKRTCNFLLKQLGPNDRLSVVAFDSEVRPKFTGCSWAQNERSQIAALFAQ